MFEKGHIPWHKGKTGVYSDEVLKKMSDKKIGTIGFWKGKNRSFEDKLKMSIGSKGKSTGKKNSMYGKRGSLAPGWLGGKSRIGAIIRRSFELRDWRRLVFERDNYTCKQCASKRGNKNDGNEIYLEAHHRIPIRKLVNTKFEKFIYDVQNGITLCTKCHDLIPKK